MLTNAELELIDALHGGREATVHELADETGLSTSQIYRTADELLTEGLIDESRGHHNQRLLCVTGHPVIEAYRSLISKLGHVNWPDLLSPATIRICWFLDEPRRATTIADRLDITRQAVHHALDPLKHRAMLSPSGPEYALVPSLQPLHDFAEAVILHEHRARVRRLAPSATVEWFDPERALVHVHTKDDTAALQAADEWEMTGLARFATFDLQFFLAGEPALVRTRRAPHACPNCLSQPRERYWVKASELRAPPHRARTDRREGATQYRNMVQFGIHSLGPVCVSQGRGREAEWWRHSASESYRV